MLGSGTMVALVRLLKEIITVVPSSHQEEGVIISKMCSPKRP